MTPAEFIASLPETLGPVREGAIRSAFLGGAGVLWPMVEVAAGGGVSFFAAIDVLAIGEPGECVRVPMAPRTAQAIGDALGFMLPTARMSDLIWKAAALKLSPRAHPESVGKVGPGGQTSTSLFALHSSEIDTAIGGAPVALVAGHKKDVVICNRLARLPGRVAIYGWHSPAKTSQSAPATLDGCFPIQPLSTRHANDYADYSHGVRAIGLDVRVDGVLMPISSALSDPLVGARVAAALLCPSGAMPFNNPKGAAADDAAPLVLRVPDHGPDGAGEGPIGTVATITASFGVGLGGSAGAEDGEGGGLSVVGSIGVAGVLVGLAFALDRVLG